MENKTDEGLFCLFCHRATKCLSEFSEVERNKKCKLQHRFFTLVTRQLLSSISGSVISKQEKKWCENNLQILSDYIRNTHINNNGFLKNSHFCKKCDLIAQQFCELYQQIKQLKLQLDWKISKLSNVMRSANKKSLKKTLSNELLDTCVDGLLLKEIRKTLNQSFKTYHKIQIAESFPRVHLSPILIKNDEQDYVPSLFDPIILDETPEQPDTIERLDNNASQLETDKDETNVELECQLLPITQNEVPIVNQFPSPEPNIVFAEKEIPIIDLSSTSPLPQFPVPEIETSFVHTSQSNFPKSFKCFSCSYRSNIKTNLSRHNISFHPDHYFMTAKLTEVSNDDFKSCVLYLLEKTVNDSFKEDQFECSFCLVKFNGREGLRNHLAFKHSSVLKAKLVEIQKSESFHQILRLFLKNSIRKENVGSHVCSICYKRFIKRGFWKLHQCTVHPELYFERYKKPTVNDRVFRMHIMNLVNQGFSTLSTGAPPQRDIDGRMKVQLWCHYCDKFFTRPGHVKSHIIFKHHQTIVEKLDSILCSEKSAAESNLEILRMQPTKIISRAKKSKVNLSRRLQACPVCEKVFQDGFHLNQHQSFEHPELFFETSNLNWMSENTQFFKRFVDHFLVQETQQRFIKLNAMSGANEHVKFKCSICSTVLQSLRQGKIHLVLRHRKIMAGKLEHLQSSGKTKHELEVDLENVWKCMPSSKRDIIGGYSSPTPLDQNICKFCSKRFSRRQGLNIHLASRHANQFFECVKSPNLTPDQFNDCVQNMLSEVFGNLEKSVDDVYGTVKWQCPFCPKQIVGLWKGCVRGHVFTRHSDVLSEKFKRVQESWKLRNL